MVLVILIAAACVGGYYYYLRKESARIDSQISFYRQEEVKLRGAVALNKEVNDLKKLVEERIGIIRELTGGSEVRFSMLEQINLVMPENLWLMSISENEQAGTVNFTIEGCRIRRTIYRCSSPVSKNSISSRRFRSNRYVPRRPKCAMHSTMLSESA
jgi:Tfp pilus assembly protein PilN